jgi:hypothetical protein
MAAIMSFMPTNITASGKDVPNVTGQDPTSNLTWMMDVESWDNLKCFEGTAEQMALAQEFTAFLEVVAGEPYSHPAWLQPLKRWLGHIANQRIPWVPQLLFVWLLDRKALQCLVI